MFLFLRAEVKVKEVLLGTPAFPVLLTWEKLKPGSGGVCAEDSPVVGQEGHERIWCLDKREDGTWGIWHPSQIVPPGQRALVEKALQSRLTPDLETLQASKDLVIGLYEPGARNPGAPERPVIGTVEACKRLAEAGPAARPVAKALLRHPSPCARAWGCRLAHLLGDPALVEDVSPLLDDSAEVAVRDPGDKSPLAVSEIALVTLRCLAGKAGQAFTSEEAKAWVASRKGALTPSPGSP